MSSKPPSHGTKVAASANNDPVLQENPGKVQPDSLAAESAAFRRANNPENQTQTQAQTQTQTQQHQRPQEGNAATARGPGTSTSQEEDARGAEGEMKNASFTAEIGAPDDPSLSAERKFVQGNAVAPGAVAGAGAGAGRGKVGDRTAFEGLGEREA